MPKMIKCLKTPFPKAWRDWESSSPVTKVRIGQIPLHLGPCSHNKGTSHLGPFHETNLYLGPFHETRVLLGQFPVTRVTFGLVHSKSLISSTKKSYNLSKINAKLLYSSYFAIPIVFV